jgi:outer membrane immunogenic protein
MKHALSATLIAGALAVGMTAASAADLPLKAPPLVVPPFSWAGFYVGVNAGGVWDRSSFDLDPGGYSLPSIFFNDPTGAFAGLGPVAIVLIPGTIPLPGTVTLDSGRRSSFLGGVQAGYNWQFGSTVVGLEGQVDGLKVSQAFAFVGPAQTFTGAAPGTFISRSLTGAGTIERDIEGSLRGRVGHAWDRWLVYGTGGVAVTSVRARGTFNANLALSPVFLPIPGLGNVSAPSSSDSSKTLVGPTVGFGAEYAVSQNVTLGAEYRHTFYGSQDISLGMTPAVTTAGTIVTPGAPVSGGYRLDTDEVMVRLNWLLNK